MRVAAAGRAGVSRGGEAPYAVAPRKLVREPLLGEPLEHAVERHAVDIVAAAQAALDLVMCQRLVGAEQRREHFDAGARLARPGCQKQRRRLRRGIGREMLGCHRRSDECGAQAIIAPACTAKQARQPPRRYFFCCCRHCAISRSIASAMYVCTSCPTWALIVST